MRFRHLCPPLSEEEEKRYRVMWPEEFEGEDPLVEAIVRAQFESIPRRVPNVKFVERLKQLLFF